MKKINLEITGNEDSILEFIALCGKIEMLCSSGSSRRIMVDIDGDGSANLKFKSTAKVVDLGEVDLIKAWVYEKSVNFIKIIDSGKDIKHSIGE